MKQAPRQRRPEPVVEGAPVIELCAADREAVEDLIAELLVAELEAGA